jgi:DUF1680 family protein
MGLVKLYRITGKKEYLMTAKFFIDERAGMPAMMQRVRTPGKVAHTGKITNR